MAKKTPFDRVRKAFASVGLDLVSTTYKNNWMPLQYRCAACGYEGEKRLACVRRGQGCPRCGRQRVAESQRHTLAFAKEAFARKALELEEGVYHDARSPMSYRCCVCGFRGRLRLANLLTGTGCRKCGIQKRFTRHRINFPDLKAQLLARGIETLSSECKYHCSRIQVRCLKCLKQWASRSFRTTPCLSRES
jgi:hypothetical protein